VKQNCASHRIESAFNGTLSRKLVEVGEMVTPGTGLAELCLHRHAASRPSSLAQRFLPSGWMKQNWKQSALTPLRIAASPVR